MKIKTTPLLDWKLSFIGLGFIICALFLLGSSSQNNFHKEEIQQQFTELEQRANKEVQQLMTQLKLKKKTRALTRILLSYLYW